MHSTVRLLLRAGQPKRASNAAKSWEFLGAILLGRIQPNLRGLFSTIDEEFV